ncbi:MAG: serine/threonine-protein phosphatase [Bacteroidia bacterium]|nr:serine/threonine-protein phosphatase [Bacteroidia bacterium]
MINAYNTNDPAKLLLLKRQEADAMLDVLRAVQPNLTAKHFIFIVVNTIRAQLGVKKILLVSRTQNEYHVLSNFGFSHLLNLDFSFLGEIRFTQPCSPVFSLPEPSPEYIVPLGNKQNPEAWFLVSEFADSDSEVENDLIFMETLGNILVITLNNIRLFEEKIAQQRIEQELELAEKIQKQLLASNFQIHPRTDIFALNLSHHKVGGDFYDLIPISEHEFYVCIADVAGKGIAAALMVSNLQANLRALVYAHDSPVQIIENLNKVFLGLTKGEHFVTLFLGRIDLATNTMKYINAGHNSPIFVHDNQVLELSEGSIPVGILEMPFLHCSEIRIETGDRLFLYTDGIVEQNNPDGELLGLEPIRNLLVSLPNANSQTIVSESINLVQKFAQKEPAVDDISCMSIRFL